MTFGEKVLNFNKTLTLVTELPKGVVVMNPFKDSYTFSLCRAFYAQYYNDSKERHIILGINPGRLGGGLTGIPFTDPVKLEKLCGITNTLEKKSELSADFIYKLIYRYGGIKKFYNRFYFNSICPLGFMKDGKNLNYYDIKELEQAVKGFMIHSLNSQIKFGINTDDAFCLGEGKNFKFISGLNEEHHFFKKIIPLAHPRFIMQYRRKKLDEYISDYLQKFRIPQT
ncbi:MAG: uracil-DNA glycosylase family protein [Bacteroidota bacterium]